MSPTWHTGATNCAKLERALTAGPPVRLAASLRRRLSASFNEQSNKGEGQKLNQQFQPAPSTPENPWSVAFVNGKVQGWIERLGFIWVEGEVIQYNPRPNAKMQYFTLRDLNQQASVDVTIWTNNLQRSGIVLEPGAKVVVYAKPDFYLQAGRFSLRAEEVRAVGLGDLLARLERLKQLLAQEGLFEPRHKKPLPFLPGTIGLITGRNSKAMTDVTENSQRRWPSARFEIREVASQGNAAVAEIKAALIELDALTHVEVIVIARGGGSVEDLLPYSDEGLVRAVFAARTPIVSAIGHETDNPILDYVADLRASVPTDAAKWIVPDVAELRADIRNAQSSMRLAISNMLEYQQRSLDDVRSRPVLAAPGTMVESRENDLKFAVSRLRHRFESTLQTASAQIDTLTSRLRTLSPLATMERGFAIVQRADGAVVKAVADVHDGDALLVKLTDGTIVAKALKVKPQ